MNQLSPVYTLQNECRDCYRCVRECYVKAIRIKDDSASVIGGKCIACGACVRACPSGAKRVRQDINLIKTGKKVFVKSQTHIRLFLCQIEAKSEEFNKNSKSRVYI
ncbi:MAG: 4Fe-4S binding protein [Endomicrobium sp.]|jgi:ferredoxin|nr:4Fe-4S binding protein [Endomicrobium sp.]